MIHLHYVIYENHVFAPCFFHLLLALWLKHEKRPHLVVCLPAWLLLGHTCPLFMEAMGSEFKIHWVWGEFLVCLEERHRRRNRVWECPRLTGRSLTKDEDDDQSFADEEFLFLLWAVLSSKTCCTGFSFRWSYRAVGDWNVWEDWRKWFNSSIWWITNGWRGTEFEACRICMVGICHSNKRTYHVKRWESYEWLWEAKAWW